MNFFFSINSSDFKSTLTVPKFQNRNRLNLNCKLYSATISNDRWIISEAIVESDSNFFYINEENDNHQIFFLANDEEIKTLNYNKGEKLINLNLITDTDPAFRANLEVENISGGISSYQSEYPYDMICRRGSVLSPISTLLNVNAEINRIYFRNIFFKPLFENFKLYIIDTKSKRILKSYECKTNYTNEIIIEKKLINENNYIFTKDYLGVPIFFSCKKNHLSLEHTHPPHLYLFGKDKFKITKDIKENLLNEIFEKNN